LPSLALPYLPLCHLYLKYAFFPFLFSIPISLVCFFHHFFSSIFIFLSFYHYYALLLNYFICIFVFFSMSKRWELVCS
jgi:hypothetical protein